MTVNGDSLLVQTTTNLGTPTNPPAIVPALTVQSPRRRSSPQTTNGSLPHVPPPPVPPRVFEKKDEVVSPSQELFDALGPVMNAPVVGSRLENLALDEFDDFDPRQENNQNTAIVNGLTNKPVTNGTAHAQLPLANGSASPNHGKDLFGADPFVTSASNPQSPDVDPFGMGDFNPPDVEAKDLESAIGALDKKINEMRDGFRRGLSFGNDEFPLEDLDPLVNKPST